jgi:hypothetical protein
MVSIPRGKYIIEKEIIMLKDLDIILSTDQFGKASVAEGSLISVNKIVSDAIGIPPGDYVIWALDYDVCNLIPTVEAAKQTHFEVHRKTLEGFYNPEIHKKIVDINAGGILND